MKQITGSKITILLLILLLLLNASCQKKDHEDLLKNHLLGATVIFTVKKSNDIWRIEEILWSSEQARELVTVGDLITLAIDDAPLGSFDHYTERLIIRMDEPPRDGFFIQNELTLNSESRYVFTYRMSLDEIMDVHYSMLEESTE